MEYLPGCLAHRLHVTFDLALVAGMPNTRRIEKEPVVFGQLGVGAVEVRVVEIRCKNAGLQVVEHDAAGYAAKGLEHPDVRAGKAHLVLAEGQFDVLQATV